MQVTEQNKQEAEKVVVIYYPFTLDFSGSYKPNAISCAIQDRQSVLDLAIRLRSNSMSASSLIIEKEITNLTEQINYLQSKL